MAVRPRHSGGRGEARPRPRRGPRHASDAQALRPARGRRPGDPVPGRLGPARRDRGRVDGPLLGRAGADLPGPPRDLLDQLDLPLLWPAAVQHRRSVHERLLAGAALVRRVLAPQPPRLPTLRSARAEVVGGRPGRLGDPGDDAAGARVERGADHAGAAAGEAGVRWAACRCRRSPAAIRGGSATTLSFTAYMAVKVNAMNIKALRGGPPAAPQPPAGRGYWRCKGAPRPPRPPLVAAALERPASPTACGQIGRPEKTAQPAAPP